jgi:hypothetical protein
MTILSAWSRAFAPNQMNQVIVEIEPASTNNLPDWRFRRAYRAAVQGQLLTSASADPETRQLSRLLFRQKRCRTTQDRHRLRHSRLGQRFDETIRLAHDATRESVSTVETLIVADVSPKNIAERCGISIPAAELYEHFFCDIRTRLRDQIYIYTHVIRPESRRGAPETARRRVAMKVIAFHCGPTALDDLYANRVQRTNSWEHPSKLFERLLAERELDTFAELVDSACGFQTMSLNNMRKLADSIRECLLNRCQTAYPNVRPSATADETLAFWKSHLHS